MGRAAKSRKKNGRWFSDAGGVPRDFGPDYREALSAFRAAPAAPPPEVPAQPLGAIASNLFGLLYDNLPKRNAYQRSRHPAASLEGVGARPGVEITGEPLESFLAHLRGRGLSPEYIDPVYEHASKVRRRLDAGPDDAALAALHAENPRLREAIDRRKRPAEGSVRGGQAEPRKRATTASTGRSGFTGRSIDWGVHRRARIPILEPAWRSSPFLVSPPPSSASP